MAKIHLAWATLMLAAACTPNGPNGSQTASAPASPAVTPDTSAPSSALATPSPSAAPRATVSAAAPLASASGAATPGGCQNLDKLPKVDLTGTLSTGKASHPNPAIGSFPIRVLTIAPPSCFTQDDGTVTAPLTEVQVAGGDDAMDKRLDKLAGKRVRVQGGAFFAHTAWHVRPVVVGAETVSQP